MTKRKLQTASPEAVIKKKKFSDPQEHFFHSNRSTHAELLDFLDNHVRLNWRYENTHYKADQSASAKMFYRKNLKFNLSTDDFLLQVKSFLPQLTITKEQFGSIVGTWCVDRFGDSIKVWVFL